MLIKVQLINFHDLNMKLIKHSQEFKVLELKISEDANSSHFIYFKEHAVREHTEDKPSGRTLFVVNIPPYIDEKGLAKAFKEAGNILSVNFGLKSSSNHTEFPKNFTNVNKPSFKIAYIVFEKVSELDKALKLKSLTPVNSKHYQISCGMKKWVQDYNNSVLTTKSLKQKVEEFMATYDTEVKKADQQEKELEKEDTEGWVTVTKKGKIQGFARTEKMENKIMAKEEKGRKRKELKNFYTFQIRESKMKHIVALRQKFEEDKKKIAQIKQSRRFKPF